MNSPSLQPAYFKCSMCGECCSSINIPLEARKAEHLMQQVWFIERLTQHNTRLAAVTPEFYRIPLTTEGICVFLDEQKRCLIELHEGKDMKPEECRNFPFAAVRQETENVVLYDASASCKVVAEELIQGFSPVLPHPDMQLNLPLQNFPEQVRVGRGKKTISWQSFMLYQQQLREVFANPHHSPALALKITQELLQHLQKTGQAKHPTVRHYSLIPHWNWLVPLIFLRKPYGSLNWVQLLIQRKYQDRHVFGSMTLRLQPKTPILWPVEQELQMKAFLNNILQRYVLFTHDNKRSHSLASLLSIACVGYFMVRWHAGVLAEIRDPTADTVTEADVAMAIRLTERYYTGHQPRFLAWFREHPLGHKLHRFLLG